LPVIELKPILEISDHWQNSLSAISTSHCVPSINELRASLLTSAPQGVGWNFDELADLLDANNLRQAAVLIGLIARESGWHVLLTKRTDTLSAHAGQVAFPGGRVDANDADSRATALRETWEEVGIPAHKIHAIGYLERFATISNFSITPVVAILDNDIAPTPQQSEVAAIFEVPLSVFQDSARRHVESRVYRGKVRSATYFVHEARTDAGVVELHRIWGATAAMLVNFVDRLI
jgi:8-oxo-dGTP pyrophosphatase MutT (NUDIX family)